MKTFVFEIFSLTQKENSFTEATSLKVPTSAGEISVYASHMPLLTDVLPGNVEVKSHEKKIEITQSGGILSIKDNMCRFFKSEPVTKIDNNELKEKSMEEITREVIQEFMGRLSQKSQVTSS